MRVELPESSCFAGLVVSGEPKQGGATQPAQMAIVLKGAYDLVDDGAGVHDLKPASDPARAALVLADEGNNIYHRQNQSDQVITPSAFGVDAQVSPPAPYFTFGGSRVVVKDIASPDSLSFDLVREADLAIGKARVDLVVEGSGGAAVAGAVTVDDKVWFTRDTTAQATPDTGRNLFGWHSRTDEPRKSAATVDTLMFNNFYRRSTGFETPGNLNSGSLKSGSVVKVFLNKAATGTPMFSARLPQLDIAMRLRVRCPDSPDVAARWRIVDRPNLVADTLVLRPAEKQASILWRGQWPASLEAPETYRAVQIRQGGF